MSIKQVIVCDDCGRTVEEGDVCVAVELVGISVGDGISHKLFNGHLCSSCVERYHHYVPNGIFSGQKFRILSIKESEDSK